MRQKVMFGMLALAGILFVRNLYVISVLPDEVNQGQIFRIIFFHVPAAIAAMTGSAVALVASVLFLIKKDFFYDSLAVAVTEVGLAFLAVNLVTGSIWARVIWGVWWAWDPRLTSALVCWVLYAGYLILRQALEEPTQRATFAAVYSIFAFTDVPIVYFSIRWWRTIHPQPVFFSQNGSFPADWSAALRVNMLALFLFYAVLTMIRLRQEQALREIDYLRRTAHAM
ncbi:MAG TPA: cytochrome c biogenesis protein CcsA [Bryobacteraceae bacterium]|jgi:heme exporter protein C|nr:cytochrome c biogenesis protein CcsA [Bryobacteraceae bacterium]